jgi:hypothetical protein
MNARTVAAAFTASTIAALVISVTVGLFGFHESITASFVVLALVIESVAALILAAWTAVPSGSLSAAQAGDAGRGHDRPSRSRTG